MWRILLGTGIGFGLAKLLEQDKKEKPSSKSSWTDYEIYTENEEVYNTIENEGYDWAFDNLDKESFGTNTKAWNTFQKMKKDYQDFNSKVDKRPKKGSGFR